MTRAAIRRLALPLAVLWALLLAGCASLSAQDGAVADAPAPTRATTLRVQVDAPDALATLLMRHLDIVRLTTLEGVDAVSELELSRLIAAAPAQARELLQTEGYFDPDLRIARDGDNLRLTVRPGEQARIGRLDIELQGELQDRIDRGEPTSTALAARLRDDWALPPGSPFRNPDWSDAKAELLTQMRAAGYAAASWVGTAAEVDTAAQRVRLFLVADSGALFLSGPLLIEGLVHHDEVTVRNLAGFGAGKPLSETLLLDFQDRLRQAGLFDAISVTFDPDEAQAQATPVRVRLREAPRQVWTLGVGFSANVGARASAEHLHRRLLGRPLMARNKVEWGQRQQTWNGEIATHPLERQYRWLVGGTVDRLEGQDDIVLAQRLRLGRAQNTPRIDRFSFVEAERSSRRNLVQRDALADSTEIALSVNHHGVWRRLDSAILPTRGWTLSLQGGVGRAHGDRSASGPFSRLYGRVTGYWPLPADWYAQARVELGQVVRKDTVAVPDSQKFRAGGEDSVRGYAYRSLGPLVDGAVGGGDVLATASIEVARPILRQLPSVWGAVFVDAGRAAESFKGFDPAVGAGVGVRWRSPVGPLRLDWAYGQEVRKSRLHFSVGIAF